MHDAWPRCGRAAWRRAMVVASGRPRSSLSWHRMTRAWLTATRSLLGRRSQARHVVHDALDVVVAERLRGDGHRAVEVGRRLGLERAEEAAQIVGVLAGQTRHLLLAGEIRAVTG